MYISFLNTNYRLCIQGDHRF